MPDLLRLTEVTFEDASGNVTKHVTYTYVCKGQAGVFLDFTCLVAA